MANYTIIGSDGKEYGPVSAEDLQKWIAEGRANAQTQVRAEGAADWQPLAAVPELSGPSKAMSPPPLSIRPPVATSPTKTSVMAILSLVLGVLGLFTCGGTALFGLVLGIIAMVQVSKSRGELGGKGLALAGVIVSGIFLLMIPLFLAMAFPAFAAAKQKAQEINCINNEKELALAIKVYSNDNHDHLPPAATWCDAIKANAGADKVFKCPAAKASGRCDYAFNAKLDGLDENKINPQTVMIFEADADWNAHGGAEMLAAPRHHVMTQGHREPVVVVALADGSVQSVPESRLSSLRWDP